MIASPASANALTHRTGLLADTLSPLLSSHPTEEMQEKKMSTKIPCSSFFHIRTLFGFYF